MTPLIQNSLLFVGGAILFLTLLLIFYWFFGKMGLYVYIGFATILANIQVCKSVEVFTLASTAGEVLYASSFLCTDILSEKYGKKAANKGVFLGIAVNILWIIGTQITLAFVPAEHDLVDGALQVIFGMAPRITAASLVAYICSQSVDVFLYHFIWKKTGNSKKGLWLRNNGSTLCSQFIDTSIFVTIAFLGVYETPIFLEILGTTYLFKAIVALMDTPFIYIARKIKTLSKDDEYSVADRQIAEVTEAK